MTNEGHEKWWQNYKPLDLSNQAGAPIGGSPFTEQGEFRVEPTEGFSVAKTEPVDEVNREISEAGKEVSAQSFQSPHQGEFPYSQATEETKSNRKSRFKNTTKAFVFFIFVAGLVLGAIAGAGGYYLGSKNSSSNVAAPSYVRAKPSSNTVPPTSPSNTQLNVEQIVAQVEPAVVEINDTMGGGFFGGTQASGTGMIITPTGYVVTNDHVINGATNIQVAVANKGTFAAQVVGTDPANDVAVIKLMNVGGNLPTVTFGNSSQVQVGEPVVAIGNALGFNGPPTVTTGIVSALNRSITTDLSSLTGLIQTDAPINPGNSGGPLVDSSGAVIGMNTAIASNAQNIGFSIPSNTITSLIPALEEGKSPSSTIPNNQGGYLGVTVETVSSGVYVISVVPGSPASKAGIQPGDIIVQVNNKQIISAQQLATVIKSYAPGTMVAIVVDRNNSSLTLNVMLGSVVAKS